MTAAEQRPRRPGMRLAVVAGTVVTVAALALGVRALIVDDAGTRAALGGTQPLADSDPADTGDNDQPSLGSEDAPVVVVAFLDYTCEHCARFQAETASAMLERHGDTIRYVVRHLPSPEPMSLSNLAANAAECAHAQGRFWEYHEALFEFHAAARFGDDDLVEQAEAVGVDVDRFERCVERREQAGAVAADLAAAEQAGVIGTPGFLVNGRLTIGAKSIDHFDAEIAAALEAAGAAE